MKTRQVVLVKQNQRWLNNVMQRNIKCRATFKPKLNVFQLQYVQTFYSYNTTSIWGGKFLPVFICLYDLCLDLEHLQNKGVPVITYFIAAFCLCSFFFLCSPT